MVTNVRFKRLAALILLLSHGIVTGTTVDAGDWMPMLPSQDFYDFQLFAPPDLQEYEIYPEPSEGIFFNYDRLYWGITPPRVAGVAQTPNGNYLLPYQTISPQAIVSLNNAGLAAAATSGTSGSVIGGLYTFGSDPLQLDLNTSWMRTRMAWGNRYEGGWIYDNNGVNISYFNIGQSQSFSTLSEFAASSPTQTFTQTSAGGGTTGGVGTISNALISNTIQTTSPPPDHIISQKLTQQNSTDIQSAGVAAVIRRELGKRGSGTTARFGLGPRFLQFSERYKLGYESNQYAFNIGGGTTGGGAAGGGARGGTAGGGTAGGGTAGGGTAGGGTTGGLGGGTTAGSVQSSTSLAGGGNIDESFGTGAAGNTLGITGVDTLTGQGLGTALQTGAWETYTSNNMVGPEFSLFFESQRGRWLFTSEFKFTAGMNWQNNLYRGANFPNTLGADYLRATLTLSNAPPTQTSAQVTGATASQPPPPPMFLQLYGVGQSNATNAAEHRFVFSPIGEWRFGSQFRVSEAIRLHAGYTGMWLGSVARASTNTGYKTAVKDVQVARQNDTNQPIVRPDGSSIQPGYWYVDTQKVEYNRIAPVQGGQEYVFTNGVDFGIEVRY